MELIGRERSNGLVGECAAQYVRRLAIGTPQTTQRPLRFRLGKTTLFRVIAQDREQNFGFWVFFPQTGHSAMAILSED